MCHSSYHQFNRTHQQSVTEDLYLFVARFQIHYHAESGKEQAEFMKDRGTREQITNIRVIMDKYRECNIPLYLCFIDYSKALDCVNHNLLWMDVQRMGFPQHVIQLLAHLYWDQLATVRTPCGEFELSSISCDVRQGCILSPTLFNIYIEDVIREATENSEAGIKIAGRTINNLRYADVTTLLCKSEEKLMSLLSRIDDLRERKGLLVKSGLPSSGFCCSEQISQLFHPASWQYCQIQSFIHR